MKSVFNSFRGQKDILLKISKVLLTGISKLIGNASGEGIDVQSAAYQAVAQLATVFPNAVNQDVQLVVQYFNNLTEVRS
jgi:proteasome component ECM29